MPLHGEVIQPQEIGISRRRTDVLHIHSYGHLHRPRFSTARAVLLVSVGRCGCAIVESDTGRVVGGHRAPRGLI